jgi:hypothetical protein
MLLNWKRRTVDGKSATASCSRRSACSPVLLVVLFLCVLTHALQYDCVDPTEFQSLEDETESLKGEKSAWEPERATHTSPSTEQQEKVIIATVIKFSFTVETYMENYIGCRYREDEQAAEGYDHQG